MSHRDIHCPQPLITTLYYTHLQVTQTITLIGSEKSVCVNVDESYGVVYIAANQAITCVTCRFGKTNCMHVQHLYELINTVESDVPEALQHFAHLLSQTLVPPMKHYPVLSCVSKEKVPFDVPSHLSAVLRMPTEERFSVLNNVAQLVPQNTSIACSKCSQVSWSEPYHDRIATIVTTNQLLQAQGNMHVPVQYVPHLCNYILICVLSLP